MEPAHIDQPDIVATLDRLLPAMRFAQLRGWMMLIVSVTLGGFMLVALLNLRPESGIVFGTLVVGIGSAIMGAIFGPIHARLAHEAALMPALAHEMDLTYRPRAFYSRLVGTFPQRLLPRNTTSLVNALITGQIASRQVRFAEVASQTKNRRTLFDGVVMDFQNSAEVPSFFIALKSETTSGFRQAALLDTADLILLRDVSSNGRPYGVWVSDLDRAQQARVESLIDAIIASEADLGGDGTLYSAMCDRQTTWLAFRKTRDICRIGGLFATRDSLLSQLQRAAQDFGMPLRLAKRLLEIEAQAARQN